MCIRVSYQKDSQIRYSANTAYWKPVDVKIDNLIFSINTYAAVRAQKLKTNECQVSVYPRPQDIELLEKDPDINVLSQP
ncbi:ABC transporter substrate-binding protein, partial [Pseudomonas sp. 10B1]|uniref:ABC transporter substrate-binding protein n=1 Tax=Pseudomonas sp. 10B1 TaxID=3048573 RepID=UPI002B2380E0